MHGSAPWKTEERIVGLPRLLVLSVLLTWKVLFFEQDCQTGQDCRARNRFVLRNRPSLPVWLRPSGRAVQFGWEYSSRAAGRARRERHMAWSSRVGLRRTDPRTRTAYQGAGRTGPPPGADRAGPSPARGAGGGAGVQVRGAPVRGVGRAGPPPDRALARRGAGGGAGNRGRAGPVHGAGRAGPPPGADRARPSPARGAGGGAGH